MKSNFSNTKQHIGLELYLANLYVYRVSRKFVCAYFLIIFWFIVSIPFRSRREDKGTSINDVRHFLRFFDPPSPQIRFCPISAHAPILWCPFLTLRPPPSSFLWRFYFFSIFGRKILSSKLSKEILWVKEILHNGLRSFLKKLICQQKGQESQNNGMSDFC